GPFNERFLDLTLLVDVSTRSEPAHNLAICASLGSTARLKPTERAIRRSQPIRQVVDRLVSSSGSPTLSHPFAIVRVNCRDPTIAEVLSYARTSVFEPPTVEIVAAAILSATPN